jgi:hypothetical protein
MNWRHVPHMEEMRNAYKILFLLLPIGVEGLHRTVRLARSVTQFLAWVISIPFLFSTSFIASYHVCLDLPLGLFPICLDCAYNILVKEPVRKRPSRIRRLRLEDNIKMDFKYAWLVDFDWINVAEIRFSRRLL